MQDLLTVVVLISIVFSCQSKSAIVAQDPVSDKLTITYSGDADVVQFKMFEGIHQILKKDSTKGLFEGVLEIRNLSESIFTYDIIVQKKVSLGQMVEVEPIGNLLKINQTKAKAEGSQYLWIGSNRSGNNLQSEELMGSLSTKIIKSEYLNEEREITIYTPRDVNSKTPHIYFTDGAVVGSYAPYIDFLISANKIVPIKLIGVHSSASNRYEEYVKGGKGNEIFVKHQNFFYNEVLNLIEKEMENWEGQRYLHGFSNGAVFCMHEGINNPNEFEEIVAYSTADYISPMAQSINPIIFEFDEYPKFNIAAGRYETSIFNSNLKFVEKMEENELQVEFMEFICGHDYNVWKIEFLTYIKKRFKK